MSEVLVLVERVRNTIRLGESHFREFKSALEGPPGAKRPRKWSEICRDVAEGLVAFANADGGDLLVGVEDDGTITGVLHSPDDIRRILEAPKTHVHPKSLLPVQLATSLEIDGHTVLFFSVTKGTNEIFQLTDGRCVRRIGANTTPESVERILFDRRESRSRAFDSEFVDGAMVTDLDLQRLQSMADMYLRGITPEKYLQQTGLAEFGLGGLRLRRAALLLFARDIQRWHPRCQVRILKVEGSVLKSGNEYNVTSDEFVQGNIFELLVTSWEALRPFLAYKTEFGIDTRFEQKYIYPEWACREALVNAIAHRDYVMQSSIDIFIFNDRIEIKSPGSLLSTLSIEQLLKLEGAHESRNSLVARTLRESGYMRELGEGMQRIFRLMEESDLQTPSLDTDDNSFTVTLYNKSVFNQQQLAWLAMFSGYDLTRNQQRIVVAGMNGREMSPRDIYRAMNTEDRDTYDREVTYLRKVGILAEIMSNPQATMLAKRTRKPKATIARFKVVDVGGSTAKDDQINKIVVFGLPLDASEAEVAGFFSTYGEVENVQVPPPRDGYRTKFGFVTFKDPSVVIRLVTRQILVGMGGYTLTIKIYRSGR